MPLQDGVCLIGHETKELTQRVIDCKGCFDFSGVREVTTGVRLIPESEKLVLTKRRSEVWEGFDEIAELGVEESNGVGVIDFSTLGDLLYKICKKVGFVHR